MIAAAAFNGAALIPLVFAFLLFLSCCGGSGWRDRR